MTEDTLTIKEVLEHHFRDDEVAFGKIDKRFDKHEELMVINGEHLSHLNSNLVKQGQVSLDVKSMLIEQNKRSDEHRKMLKEHMDRVEPVIKAYEDEVAGRKYVSKKGENVIKLAQIIGALIVIVTGIFWIVEKSR